jgi:hypothetical protein
MMKAPGGEIPRGVGWGGGGGGSIISDTIHCREQCINGY